MTIDDEPTHDDDAVPGSGDPAAATTTFCPVCGGEGWHKMSCRPHDRIAAGRRLVAQELDGLSATNHVSEPYELVELLRESARANERSAALARELALAYIARFSLDDPEATPAPRVRPSGLYALLDARGVVVMVLFWDDDCGQRGRWRPINGGAPLPSYEETPGWSIGPRLEVVEGEWPSYGDG